MKEKIFLLFLVLLSLYLIPTISFSCLEKSKKSNEQTLNKDNIEILESNKSLNCSNEVKDKKIDITVNLYHVKFNKVMKIPLEEYVMGVVAAEMPASFDIEALKAQAITSRTYLLYKLKKTTKNPKQHPLAPICSSTHCQVFYTKEELIEKFTQEWYDTYWTKIETAVKSTSGQILVYEGKLIEPLYHSTSGGRTENSEDVFVAFSPYLRSVDSQYENCSPKLHSKITMPISKFIEKLKGSLQINNVTSTNLKDNIKLIEISEGGKIKLMKIGDKIITGKEFRYLYNLNSANFKFIQNKDSIEIITTGYGHGVGMSQYGAHGMAKAGYNYRDILKHYYTGVKVMNIK